MQKYEMIKVRSNLQVPFTVIGGPLYTWLSLGSIKIKLH